MTEHIDKVRTAIARLQHGRPPTAVRYPAAVRHQVMAIARRRQAEGADVSAIAREVGVAPWTLALWLRKPARAVVRAVQVLPDAARADPPTAPRPVLITPRGIRVEGLDRDLLLAVLRALG